jgi:hypothetical protein
MQCLRLGVEQRLRVTAAGRRQFGADYNVRWAAAMNKVCASDDFFVAEVQKLSQKQLDVRIQPSRVMYICPRLALTSLNQRSAAWSAL